MTPLATRRQDDHWTSCDLVRPERRPLLCLECVERRLERHLVVEDLEPCLGNYYAATLTQRLADALMAQSATLSKMQSSVDLLVALSTPTAADVAADPYRSPPARECGHGVEFDHEAARLLGASEIRRRWPRLDGPCPLGCGYSGIAYASNAHYIFGDW